jgi:hypothetical protein
MKKLITILILVAPVLAFSQSGDTVFTVKLPTATVSILPEVEVLYKNVSKKFALVKSAATKIDTVVFTEGTILRKDSVFAIKPTKIGTGLLKIYASVGDGKPKLALVKEFAVRTFTEPKPNVDGVNNDSAIHRMKVVAQGYVNVPMKSDPALKRISYKVSSFEMQTSGNGKMETLKTTGNRMTYEMRDRIDHLQDGNIIQVTNIKYLIGEDTFVIKEPLRISLLDDKINKF